MTIDEGAARRRAWYRDGTRLALLTFVLVEVGAFILYLFYGRRQWFFADEWYFLSSRSLGDLVQPYNGHWTTIPLLVYRGMYSLIGLRSYAPYVAMTIGLQLTAAGLLRAMMRRIEVGPWIATAAASLFVLFGSGSQDILYAFQITFVGSLVFGLTHLLLADHAGPVDRRDWIGLAAGLAGLLCSNAAWTMVIVVGTATLIRRGWRISAMHTLPLLAIYTAWWAYFHPYQGSPGSASVFFSFVRTELDATFRALGQNAGTALALGVVLVAGLLIAWAQTSGPERRRRFALPVALLLGAMVFLLMSAASRAGHYGAGYATAGRYLHILAALLVLPLAFAADALARRWRFLLPVVLVLFLIGVPGNIDEVRRYRPYGTSSVSPTNLRQIIESVPRAPLARTVPRSLLVDPTVAWGVTVGWLLDGLRAGRIPAPRPPTPAEASDIDFRLSLIQLAGSAQSACQPLTAPITVHLARHDGVDIAGSYAVQDLSPRNGTRSAPLIFGTTLVNPSPHHVIVALSRPMTIRLVPSFGFGASLCPGVGDHQRLNVRRESPKLVRATMNSPGATTPSNRRES